jgi:hypothetical protein
MRSVFTPPKVKVVRCAAKFKAIAKQRFPTAKIEIDDSLGSEWHLQRQPPSKGAWTVERVVTGPIEE